MQVGEHVGGAALGGRKLLLQCHDIGACERRRDYGGDAVSVEARSELSGRAIYHAGAQALLVAENSLRRELEVPNDAQLRQSFQDVEGRVDLPPAEPLPHAALTGVMVVVPALPHGEQGEEPVVAGIVARDVALATVHMRERVDAERGVIEEHGAPEESDHQARPAADQPAQETKRDRGSELEFVQPPQFGKAREIGDLDEVGLGVPADEDPADVAVPEALVAWRMDVMLGVGMQVMMAVLGRPPQYALLGGALRQQGENELERAAGRVSAMREVAMITGANGKHAHR